MTRGTMFWVAAFVLTVVTAGWQRMTGPSHPYRATVAVGGTALKLSLPRSNPTTSGARVTVPAPSAGTSGTLNWRRFPTAEPFTAIPMRAEGNELAATLPSQPAAGKVEYYITLPGSTGPVRVPAESDETVILRYHGPVPLVVLIPHIVVMFLAILIGLRTGLAAAFKAPEYQRLALVTLVALTLGGLILGPMTQKYAFGAYWTGIPWGWDLTDNKTLLMWIGWAVAAVAIVRSWRSTRALVVIATVLMIAVYLVPHSVRGSQLDYSRQPPPAQPR